MPVLRATSLGDDFTKTIDISWWPQDGPRFTDEHGEVLQNVAPSAQLVEDDGQEILAERPPRQIVFCQPGEERSDMPADQITCVMSPNSFYETMVSMFAAMKQTGTVPIHMCPRMYEYTPLSPGHTIRILTLWPGSGDTQLRCETREVALGEGVYYEALSYTWGDQSTGTLISFNGLLLPIAPNLCSALLHLRLPDRPRSLWIDAVCINQLDNEEKSEQVRMMRGIYQEASRVVVWLGPMEDDSDAAMDLVTGDLTAGCDEAAVPSDFEFVDNDQPSRPEGKGKQPANEITRGRQRNVKVTVSSESREHSDDEHTPRGRLEDAESPGERAWTALHALIQRPWWSRAWVLQEYTVPRQEPIFQCGNQVATSKELQQICSIPPRTAETIASLPTPDFVAIRASFRLSPLFMTRDDFQIEGGLDLMRLLLYSLNTQATDLRDKVIALLGLASQQCRSALVPDYSKSTTQIYTETARHIIQSTGDLNILAINTASPRTAGADPPLPSWVPDWALPTTSRPPPLLQPSLYRASGPYAAYVGPPPPSDPTILEAGGIPLDRIAHVLSDDTTTIAPAQGGSSTTTTTALRRTVRALHNALLSIISARERAAGATTTGAHDAHALALARLHREATLRLDPDPRVSDQFWRTLVADAMVIRDDDHGNVHGGGGGGGGSLASPAPNGFAEVFELFLYGPRGPAHGDHGDRGDHGVGAMASSSSSTLAEGPDDRGGDDDDGGFAARRTTASATTPLFSDTTVPPDPQQHHLLLAPLTTRIAHVLAPSSSSSTRRLFVTEGGRLGVGPAGSAAGDVVAVLMGGEMPFLLREESEEEDEEGRRNKTGLVRLVGEAYVHGVMRGEVVESLPRPGEGLEGCLVVFRIC
ncbi:hypothetical protein SLS55_001742 [Diplodia seriata]|uniref:Heterokaryon incompatibility domain-containing protein n=1 Tax=Diplodia seriata TaxID=420778 RepID=A0ABR3CQ62_9PEZI